MTIFSFTVSSPLVDFDLIALEQAFSLDLELEGLIDAKMPFADFWDDW